MRTQVHQALPGTVRGRIAVATGALLLIGAGAAGLWMVARGRDSGAETGNGTVAVAEHSRYDNGLGYVTAAATPAAEEAPKPRQPLAQVPLVAGSGTCLKAMDAVREVMHAVPSGGLLPQAPGWAKLVAPRMGSVNKTCGAATAEAFRDQEFLPWNNATITAGARIPPPPAA